MIIVGERGEDFKLASFETLITMPSFRALFVDSGIFDRDDKMDLDLAEALWANRYPIVEWGKCRHDTCYRLVMEGNTCRYHREKSDTVPRFAYANSVLYIYENKGYKKYADIVAERYIGEKIERGYCVWTVDGNPFNLRLENMTILSEIAAMAIRKKLIPVSKALDVDTAIQDVVASVYKGKRGAALRWQYGLNDVAEATGMAPGTLKRRLSAQEKKTLPLKKIIGLAIEKRFGIRSA